MPVCALVACAESMGVLPCNQQMLFVYSVHFDARCVQCLLHQYITEARDLSKGKGKGDFTKQKKEGSK